MRLVKGLRIEDVVFLKIETAHSSPEFKKGTDVYDAWSYQFREDLRGLDFDEIKSHYENNAAFHAEFSRLVCVTVGRIEDGKVVFMTYSSKDEREMLSQFNRDMELMIKGSPNTVICGHTVKRFDIPFMYKRSMANGVSPNSLSDVGGKKPWEITSLCLDEIWNGCGDERTTMVSLCHALGVKSPKKEMSGADVPPMYWNDGIEGLNKIISYCEGGVLALVNCFRKLRLEDVIEDFEVKEVTEPQPEGMMERIFRLGLITDEDEAEILETLKGKDFKTRELAVKNLKATLAGGGIDVSEELELKILEG